MFSTRSFISAALLGLAAATTHLGEAAPSSVNVHQNMYEAPSSAAAVVHPAPSSVAAVVHPAPSSVAAVVHPAPSSVAAVVHPAPSSAAAVVHPAPSSVVVVHEVSSAAAVVHPAPSSAAVVHEVSSAAAVVHPAPSSAAVVHEVSSAVIVASETLHATPTLAAPTYHAAVVSTSAAAAAVPSEATVNTHVIQVGGPAGEFIFAPNNIVAMPGDLVQFQFNPKNHSVVQSTFDQPCVPIQNVMPNKTDAFFSGFMPVAAAAGNATGKQETLTYTIRVMDMKPVWFYCSQGKHCQAGMVGAINAPTSGNRTIETFTSGAAAAPENLSPGQAGGAPAVSSVAPGVAQSSGAALPPPPPATTLSGVASATTTGGPLQQSVAAAPGGISDLARQSIFGLGMGGLAAFFVL